MTADRRHLLRKVLSVVLDLLLAPQSGPTWVTVTREVSLKCLPPGGVGEVVHPSLTWRNHVTGAGASPGAAPVAMAKLEAAEPSVRPQRTDEGTQDLVDVVSEEDALMLEGGRMADSHTHTQTSFSHSYKMHNKPWIWQTSTLPTAQLQQLPVMHSPLWCAAGLSAHDTHQLRCIKT